MIANYLKIVFRNAGRHRGYSLINLSGLALGLACTILILLWVRDERGFDRFHKNADVLYRVNWDFKWNGNEGIGPGTPPPLAATLVREIPEVDAATRIFPSSQMVARYQDRYFDEDRIFGVDSNFLQLFSFTMEDGDPQTALRDPNCVVLTEATAHKYFGTESPLGKMITIGEAKPSFQRRYHNIFKVTGVVEDPPRISQIQFDMLTSISSYPQVVYFDWSWVWMQVVTYAKIRRGVPPEEIEAKIPPLVKRYAPAAFKRIGFSYEEMIAGGGHWDFRLQPLTDVYLGSAQIGNRLGPVGDRTQVYVFSIIAFLILGIACMNFMNLATAQSASRAKEIAVRKVLGSPKRLLLTQFLLESVTLSFLAMPVALFLVEVFLRPFNQLAGKSLALNVFDPPWLPGVLLILPLIVGLVAGSYPAFYLSSFMPAHLLKGASPSSTGRRRFRDVLVVFQFSLTIAMIACTLIVKKQMDYVRRADLGFDREGIVVISNDNGRLGSRTEAFRKALANHPQVIDASISTGVPPDQGFQDLYKVEGKQDEQFGLSSYMTDEHFIKTLGLTIVRGRRFLPEFSDSSNVILNEAAVTYFGLTDPVGKYITYPSRGRFRVIGVVKDFHFLSLYSPITPFALFHASSKSYTIPSSSIVVRIRQNNPATTVRILESTWKEFAPGAPFEYSFLDDNFEAQYASAERLGTVFLIFSALTVIIACVGLFGLAAYTIERRTKEVGIRKVLGASVRQITALLSRDFLRLVVLGNVIAWPVVWYTMDRWLDDFAYRADLNVVTFLLAGCLALTIALLTVFSQAVKAALSNPVEALRYE